MQGGPLMSQHCTVDTYLCLRAVRTEGAVYRNVALKQYLQNMQTSVSVFGKIKQVFVAIKKKRKNWQGSSFPSLALLTLTLKKKKTKNKIRVDSDND